MDKLKIWIDSNLPAPAGWKHIHSGKEMLDYWDKDPNFDLWIDTISFNDDTAVIEYMDGVFNGLFKDHGWNYGIRYHLHSGNQTVNLKMRGIIGKNGWTEISGV